MKTFLAFHFDSIVASALEPVFLSATYVSLMFLLYVVYSTALAVPPHKHIHYRDSDPDPHGALLWPLLAVSSIS